jgi:hypothetical protein
MALAYVDTELEYPGVREAVRDSRRLLLPGMVQIG